MAHLITPQVVPLKGQENFSSLMRTKPLVAHGDYLVHAQPMSEQYFAKKTITSRTRSTIEHCLETPPTCLDKNHIGRQQQVHAKVLLGLIVPKKCYPLAVDRNRVRRVLRAQTLLLARTLHQPIMLLFRVRAAKKGINKTALFNPHSAAFAAWVAEALLSIQNTVYILDKTMQAVDLEHTR